jgi:hypothetical protein
MQYKNIKRINNDGYFVIKYRIIHPVINMGSEGASLQQPFPGGRVIFYNPNLTLNPNPTNPFTN